MFFLSCYAFDKSMEINKWKQKYCFLFFLFLIPRFLKELTSVFNCVYKIINIWRIWTWKIKYYSIVNGNHVTIKEKHNLHGAQNKKY